MKRLILILLFVPVTLLAGVDGIDSVGTFDGVTVYSTNTVDGAIASSSSSYHWDSSHWDSSHWDDGHWD